MKRSITFLAAACALALLPLSTANAQGGSTCRLTGYTPCGKPIYSYFHVHGFDSCGRPVGHWVQQYPSTCNCRSQQQSHNHSGHSHSGTSYGQTSSGRSSGWNFFFRF